MPTDWIDRALSNPEVRLEFEIERLCQEIALILSEGIEEAGLSRKDVAHKLKVSEATISRALNGLQNVTLKTAASIAFAANARITARLSYLWEEDCFCEEADDETDPRAIEWTVRAGVERSDPDVEEMTLAA